MKSEFRKGDKVKLNFPKDIKFQRYYADWKSITIENIPEEDLDKEYIVLSTNESYINIDVRNKIKANPITMTGENNLNEFDYVIKNISIYGIHAFKVNSRLYLLMKKIIKK